MGLFSFVRGAGDKIFGGKELNENEIREHLMKQGLKLNPFTVVVENAKEGKVALIGYAETMADKEKAIVAAGNIDGVEKINDRIKIGQPQWMKDKKAEEEEEEEELGEGELPTARFYTVKSGDTLGAIAKAMYGNAGKYPVIFEANKPMLSNPDKIYPGQTLRIPPLD